MFSTGTPTLRRTDIRKLPETAHTAHVCSPGENLLEFIGSLLDCMYSPRTLGSECRSESTQGIGRLLVLEKLSKSTAAW